MSCDIKVSSALTYWRNTLADEELIGVGRTESAIRVPYAEVRNGRLERAAVEALQAVWEGRRNRGNHPRLDRAPVNGPVPLLIFAKGFTRTYKHGQAVGSGSGRAHYTLGIPARLDSSGALSLAERGRPWIGREYLTPNEEGRTGLPAVGSLAAFDRWLSENPLERTSWDEAARWWEGLWDAVTAGKIPDGFQPLDEVCIDASMPGGQAGRNILELYDALLKRETPPALLQRLCRGRGGAPAIVADGLRRARLAAPRGSMGMIHGLADSQADAIAGLTTLDPVDVLAVNGPPGTGKTTLLQSVIASTVVSRALAGGEPAVIVGTSTNNQAVTNINKSLNEILRGNPAAEVFAWARRWVPELETYGLYLPSSGKVDSAKADGIEVAFKEGGSLKDWAGLPAREGDPAYVARARAQWLQCYAEAYGVVHRKIEDGLDTLRKDLAGLFREAQGIQDALQNLTELEAWWRAEVARAPERELVDSAGGTAALEQKVGAALAQASRCCNELSAAAQEAARRAGDALADRQREMARLVDAKAKISAALAPRGPLEFLASFIRPLERVLVPRKLARLWALAAEDVVLAGLFKEEMTADDPSRWSARIDRLIEEVMQTAAQQEAEEAAAGRERHRKMEEAQARLALLRAKVTELSAGYRQVEAHYRALVERAEAEFGVSGDLRPEGDLPTTADFDRLLDRTIRHMAFQKAMRYWEGRWILEAEGIQEGKVNTSSGRKGMEGRFRRWCMLTPCLVVTLHSLPGHFRYYARGEGEKAIWAQEYLYDYIDLLIVDEAGQVAPHVGMAAFALARQAVVVGDVHQIEPVSKISSGIDYGNALQAGLGALWHDGEPAAPHLVSEPDSGPRGSMMRLAQAATSLSSANGGSEPGIFLSEHRRCRTAIIEYCNALIYAGRLRPMRTSPSREPPLPPFAWAHVWGNCHKLDASNANRPEAEAIAAWIGRRAEEWRAHYERPLNEIVAVVVPFRAQANLIRQSLREFGKEFDAITVGTVHSLQGAERPIIVFSPTYDADTAQGTLFFDRKPNLLNVAVSRAKDSFVTIGDMRLFRRARSAPSGILGDKILADALFELTDVDGNHRFAQDLSLKGERISTLDRHREVLHRALRQAKANQPIVIASPWITMRAVNEDGLVSLVADAVGRGAQVNLVVDRELSRRDPGHGAAEAIERLMQAGARVNEVVGMHNKTLIAGSSEIVEGSFNWLSASRRPAGTFTRHETSWRITGDRAAVAVAAALREFAELGATVID